MNRRDALICVLLAGITLGIYWPARHFDLVYFDDPVILQDTPEVQAGLSWTGIRWAFTSVVIANWQPMTNLSFLAVSQFWGASPGPQHLANAFIHVANVVLLFLLLKSMTGATWRSSLASAIFAWHPLRVESVAWIIERKDVLCAFFFLMSLLAYVWFVQKRLGTVKSGKWNRQPICALVAFVLALMSKPMAVTLPFVLLLLDVWPLKRTAFFPENAPAKTSFIPTASLRLLIFEKWPFFGLTFLFCAATFFIQHQSAAMTSWDTLGLEARVANAISSYVAYAVELIWPWHLAAIYPFPKDFDVVQTILKAALLLAISLGCLRQLRLRPWLAAGWFWYIGMMIPVIGIVQVGEQSMADRYTYLPLIGPVIALVWAAAELLSPWRTGRIGLTGLALLIVCALIFQSERQLQYWQNTITLFDHNVTVTPENASAFSTLGLGYEHAGDTNRAIVCYRTAKMLEPRDFQNRRNLASLLVKEGFLTAAENEYQTMITANPNEFDSYLGYANLLAMENRMEEYVSQLETAVRLYPDDPETLNNLAWALATSPHIEIRDGQRAVALAQHACELTAYTKTIFIGTLAAAYAEAGRFDDAIANAQRACDQAKAKDETALLQSNEQLMQLYQAHAAFHTDNQPK